MTSGVVSIAGAIQNSLFSSCQRVHLTQLGMEEPLCFKVLYTKHVRQKRKVYQDGYLSISESRVANLYNEQGQLVASSRVPQSLQIDLHCEALTLFEGLLVDCDETCCWGDILSVKKSQSDGAGKPACDAVGAELGVEDNSNGYQKKKKSSVNDRWVPYPQISTARRRRFLVPVQKSTNTTVDGEMEGFQLQHGTSNGSWSSPRGTRLPAKCFAKNDAARGRTGLHGDSSTQENGAQKRSDDDILAMFIGTKQPVAYVTTPEGSSGTWKSTQSIESSDRLISRENRARMLESAAGASSASSTDMNTAQDARNVGEKCRRMERPITGTAPKRSQTNAMELAPLPAMQYVKKRKFEAPKARLLTATSGIEAIAAGTDKAPKLAMLHGTCSSSNALFDLKFPSEWEKWTPSRRVDVPNCFSSLNGYRERWGQVIEEELNLKLGPIAMNFHAQLPECHPMQQQDDPRQQGGECQDMARRKGIGFHEQCVLEVYKRKKLWGQCGGTKVDGLEGPVEKTERLFLKLAQMGRKTMYRKHDLWVLSTSKNFSLPKPSTVGDKAQAPWTAVFISLWHGPTNEGKLELELVSERPHNMKRGSQAVNAIHGPQGNLEWAMKESLQDLDRVDGALMDFLLTGNFKSDAKQSNEDTQQHDVEAPIAISKFKLNPEQAMAIWHAHSWLPTSDPKNRKPPVCLIHGPFGSGKSTLLVSIIHVLAGDIADSSSFEKLVGLGVGERFPQNRLFFFAVIVASQKATGRGLRVLVSAHTNVAVDRILAGLLQSGFTDFIRVGSLQKIAKPMLKHSVHCSEGGGTGCIKKSNAIAELRKMLKECVDQHERAIIRQELVEAEQGAERIRRRRLRSACVVGVTCCSSSNPLLADLQFDVVILDEASQMTEPLSLMPIIRAKARFLIAAGDPCQLPPVIARPTILTCNGMHSDKAIGSKHGLLRPLFVRLASIGCTPILLRHQYRCHPKLADLPNRAFYGGCLLSGITQEDRPALMENWQPIVSLDVRGCANGVHGSVSNRAEAEAVVNIVKMLYNSISNPCSLGVICFFKKQVSLIETMLSQLQLNPDNGRCAASVSVQVATVDSFQGMEKDVIVLSTSITRPGAFTSDAHRLNVAMTRAKNHLVVVGCLPALQQTSKVLAELISISQRLSPDCTPVDTQTQAITQPN